MNLSSSGELSGEPSELGSFSFIVHVTDSNDDTAEKAFTLNVFLTVPPPDIRISKVGITTVPGRNIDYFIAVENTGVSAATDVVIEEHLVTPRFRTDLFSFVSADPEPDFVEDGFVLAWLLPPLFPGERELLSYKVQLNPSVGLGTPIVGSACFDDDGGLDLGAMQRRMSAAGDDCRQCVHVCTGTPLSPCKMLEGCVDDCDDLPFPLKKICIAACGILFAECSGCLKGCADICDDECPATLKPSTETVADGECRDCPDECGCDEQVATGPIDPNEKLVVTTRYIQPDQTLVYPIHFENIGEVEAIDVFITDELDPNLDLSTLEILVPDGASLNASTRTVRWNLLNRNLQPGETDNVLLAIKPLPGLSSGTEIRNDADIQFEIFETITTDEVVNIIDSTPPTGTMDVLPEVTQTLDFDVSWAGADAVGEIESFDILVSVDGGDFTSLLVNTVETRTAFRGEHGRTYGFLCLAEDTAGNMEVQELIAEAVTRVVRVTKVRVDIKPGGDTNSINCNNKKGVIPVAILSTDDFDATTVDHATVRFGQAGTEAVETHNDQTTLWVDRHEEGADGAMSIFRSQRRVLEPRRHEEDVDNDGDVDLVFHFRFAETNLACGDKEATLTGETFEGRSIVGTDAIRTVGKTSKTTGQLALQTFVSVTGPNPANPSTSIEFGLRQPTIATLSVYSVAGRMVRTLIHEWRAAGIYETVWDGLDNQGIPVATGVYLLKLRANEETMTQKLVVLK